MLLKSWIKSFSLVDVFMLTVQSDVHHVNVDYFVVDV